MSLEKTMQKIQSEINGLKSSLDLFFEDGIQPSVSDCEYLQQQLNQLEENLAVYKYHKQNYELSPSFNLHAKISEIEPAAENKMVSSPEPEVKKTPETEQRQAAQELKTSPVVDKTAPSKTHPKLAISLNDKFRFINELFAQNNAEYNIAMEQLNNLRNWADTEIYLNSLRNLYAWNEGKEIVRYFYTLVKKRFD